MAKSILSSWLTSKSSAKKLVAEGRQKQTTRDSPNKTTTTSTAQSATRSFPSASIRAIVSGRFIVCDAQEVPYGNGSQAGNQGKKLWREHRE
jgi:hypothetical protein